MSTAYLLAIDQGTTNSRAIIFDQNSRLISLHGRRGQDQAINILD